MPANDGFRANDRDDIADIREKQARQSTDVGAAGILARGPRDPWLRALSLWLWLGSPATFLPVLPWTLRFRLGAPLSLAELFPDLSMAVEVMVNPDRVKHTVTLTPEDQKDAEAGEPMRFAMEEVPVGFRSSLVPVLLDPDETAFRAPSRPAGFPLPRP